MILFILFHVLLLSGYALLVAALLWHYRSYSLPGDPARWVIGPFIGFSILLALVASILLFYIPWDDLSGAILSLIHFSPSLPY
mgnify:CR=1